MTDIQILILLAFAPLFVITAIAMGLQIYALIKAILTYQYRKRSRRTK